MVEKRQSAIPSINEPYEDQIENAFAHTNELKFEQIEEEEKSEEESSDSETEGAWDDDNQSVDLDALTTKRIEMTDDELMELLVGKHRINDKGKLLHIGIIDYLQTYTTFKKTERLWKQIKRRGADVNTFSVAPPGFYGTRFIDFMENKIFTD